MRTCKPVAGLAEDQIEIVECLNTQTSRLQAVEGKIRVGIDRLQEFRTALISAAVTGKIDVREEAG